jgi:hypothetical protein
MGDIMFSTDPASRAAWVIERKAELVEVNRKIEEAEHAAIAIQIAGRLLGAQDGRAMTSG